jgi:STE24 endopeptidase
MRFQGRLRPPRSAAVRIGGVAVAMVLVAEGAVWLLAPRADVPEPVAIAEGEYFAPAELDRARDYRDGQRWLFLAAIGAQGIVLGAAALGRPQRARQALERLGGRRPLAAAALAGGGVAVAAALAALPPRIAAHERAVDVGLSVQSLGSWLWDFGRSTAITAVLAAGGAALLIALVRRLSRGWWLPASGAVVAFAILFTWIAPVVLAPIFNRFEALPAGSRVRGEVLALARDAGVEVGEVYSVDASRRVSSLNAYIDGIGASKRVVLYDTLLAGAERRELASVVAHELGHVAADDIPRGLAYVAIVAPLGLLFTRELGGALARRAGVDPRGAAAVPAYLLALSLAAIVLNVPGNQLSRKVEARADAFALELTDDPAALVDLQLRLGRENLSDPSPPGLARALLATHPSTVERIGAAVAYSERQGP